MRSSGASLVDETVRAVSGYYGRLARIGLDLARAVVPVDQLREAVARLPIEVTPSLDGARRTVTSLASVASAPAADDLADRPTLLVEADGDRPGFGVFIVENLTAEPVSAPISVSVFVDDLGREVRPRLLLRPATVSLGPGEQAMVQLAAELDEALESGVRYHGEIAIPALSDRRIPIVLRRRPVETVVAASSPVPTAASPGATAASPTATPVRRRASGPAATPPAATPVRRRASGPAPAPTPRAIVPRAARPRRRRATTTPDEPT